MRIYRASSLLVGLAIAAAPVFAADWQPAATPFRVGTPVPIGAGQTPHVSIRKPIPLDPARHDPALRQASYLPAPEAIFRGKFEIPRILPRSAVGLMPVMQGEVIETGTPKAEDIPLMPKQLGTSEPDPFYVPPTEPAQPDNLTMPYADGVTPPEGIIVAPEGGAYPHTGLPLGPGDAGLCCDTAMQGDCCGPMCCICDPCCQSTQCCSCVPCCCGPCMACGCCDCYPRPHAWISGELLYLNYDRQGVPPLLTTSNQADNGVLGAPSTRVLYGEDQLNNNNWHPGFRVALGFWCRRNPCWGMDASAFYMFRDKNVFSAASGGTPLLARPYFNPDGTPNFVLIAKDGVVRGNIAIRDDSRLWGYDVNVRRKWCCGCNYHFDLLFGYRQMQLSEGIEIDDFEADAALPDTQIAFDRFRTNNNFYGGQIGIDGEYTFRPRWTLAGSLKVAFGVVQQNVSINGFTDITEGGVHAVGKGGILALASNIGDHQRSRFAIAPELQLKLQYHLNENCRVFVGYNVMMISSVVRPGEQIDLTLDDSQFPSLPGNLNPTPGARPAVLFNTSPFVAQGVSIGLLCNY